MQPIRVLVVDDSRFMVSLISSVLEAAGDIKVVGFALDGQDAVEKARALRPDVITMDVVMPRMDGLQATRLIVAEMDTPILVLSAYTSEGAGLTLDALQAGAVDCIAKPSGERSMSLESVSDELVLKVRGIAEQRRARGLERVPSVAPVPISYTSLPSMTGRRTATGPPAVVAIGASTGGIQALNAILPRFTAKVPFSVVVVQHFPEGFTAQLAVRLHSICSIPVREAESGMRLMRASAIIAPGGSNMEITRGLRVRLSKDGGPCIMRPSIDVTFRSIARVFGPSAVAVVLTGMGKDGAEGAGEIWRAGGRVVVQDYHTATAYGMPRAVQQSGAYDVVLPLESIPACLLKLAEGQGS